MRRRAHRAATAVVLAGALLALTSVASAQDAGGPAPMEGADVTDTGWWNRAHPEVDLPTGQPPPPPVPGVPEGSLVVGATVGDPDAITAVDIAPDSLPGATVNTFELTMREVSDDGANLNTPFAVIVACPITEFWLGGENGIWETRPAFDCELAEAEGVRSDDGTWTWDLAAIGALWSAGDVDSQGVALVEKVEPPTSFRAAFAGAADQAIGVRYVASGGEEPEDLFAGGGFDTGDGGGVDSQPAPDTGGIDSGFSLPPVDAPEGTADAGADTTTTTVPEDDDEEVASAPIANEPISPLGSLQWWTWPLLAVLVGVAVLCMLALGPGGEPLAASTRRGVTRALEARTRTEEP